MTGDRLFVGREGNQVTVVTLSSGATSSVDIPECGIYDLVATPDGRHLLATCSSQGTAMILDAPTLIPVATIQTGGIPRRAAISADGTIAVIANEGGWYDHVE